MDWVYVLLVVSNLVTIFFVFKAINQRDEAREMLRHQSFWFDKLSGFVFANAKFSDQSGKADGDYNSDDVAAKWSLFHDIGHHFYNKEDV